MHADRTQAQRNAALMGFKAGKYQIMVATDIAARGSPKGNREGAAVEKNATPARFRRENG